MALQSDVRERVLSIFDQAWESRNGITVPTVESIPLAGGAVKLDAAFLYADLADSTRLASNFPANVAAKVVRAFLDGATRLIRANGGEVRSFDGDRVMGVFAGQDKETRAMKAALYMNWAVSAVIRPEVARRFPSLAATGWSFAHGVGVDTGPVTAVRAGPRGDNDIVWIGRAPNVAAKLSSLREPNYSSYVTAACFDAAGNIAKYASSLGNALMWEERTWNPTQERVHRSSWRWRPL
jgi:class 3 adenylate cyclase